LFIEKESDINESIERYRNAATQALLTQPDTIVIASVSCIYGLGNPETYLNMSRAISVGESFNRSKFFRYLTDMQYTRSEIDFSNGDFRVRGDTIDIYLASDEEALRIEFFGDEIEAIKLINPISGEIVSTPHEFKIFPAKQFVTPFEALKLAIPQIKEELKVQIAHFKKAGKDLEAHRLEQRVSFDIEMLLETGYCSGIENYSRYIENREPGSPPSTLVDYFPDGWLLFIDESHITLPQVRGMFNGDQARKETLVDYGFRLPAAKDNRPLTFEEFNNRINQAVYVSATPADYEINLSKRNAAVLRKKSPDYFTK
jgi:excinuclease ABC subunit B